MFPFIRPLSIWLLLASLASGSAGPREYAICQSVVAIGCGPVGYAACQAAAAIGCIVTDLGWEVCYAGCQEVCADLDGSTFDECYAEGQGYCAKVFPPAELDAQGDVSDKLMKSSLRKAIN